MLERLHLGATPYQTPTGVTAAGLVGLVRHCQDLCSLRIHFQAASLNTPPAVAGIASNIRPTSLRWNYALTDLDVGEIPVSEDSVLMTALTLSLIFPHLEYVDSGVDENWEKVIDVIGISGQVADRSGMAILVTSRDSFSDTYPGATLETGR